MKTKVSGIVPDGIREAYITERIAESGMTQAQVAECAGIPASTLNAMLKRGIAGSALDTVVRICDILDIDLNSFVRGEVPGSTNLYFQRANMSERIHQTRVKLRYRLGAVADYLSVSESFYREMEGGLQLISDSHVKQLAFLFGVPAEYLYCRTDECPALDGTLFDVGFDSDVAVYNYGIGIQQLRENCQLTRSVFAAHIGIDAGLLSDWEDDIRVPRTEDIAKIATHFSVLPGTLCTKRVQQTYSEEIAALIAKFETASERDQQLVRLILDPKSQL